VNPEPPPAGPAAGAAPPSAAQPRKKTSPIVWILVGVFGLFVLAGIAVVGAGIFVVHKAKQAGLDPELMERNPGLALTKLLTAMNPEVEVVKVDEGKGVITIREKKTGKVVTLDFEAVKQGRISFQEEGKDKVTMEAHGESGSLEVKSGGETMKFGSGAAARMPDWIPAYPGASAEGTFSMQGSEGEGGTFALKTKDPVKKVAAFYEEGLKQAGFQISSNSTHSDGASTGGMLVAEHAASKRTVMVTMSSGEDGTQVGLVFEVKK
jgi:hypothetical protein